MGKPMKTTPMDFKGKLCGKMWYKQFRWRRLDLW